jgi:phthiocerol/phenolphthiocerol synthesis type-I polyketide synthase C
MTSHRGRSPVAVIGFAFRMPGTGSEGLWEALLAQRDLVSSVQASRWVQDPYLHPRKGEPGTSYTFAAGSIGDVAGFDAGFFGISPREAEQMDPQQRVLLEMVWEAFEQAGVPPSSMRGSRCGVFVGLSSIDYVHRLADDLGAIDSSTMTGVAGSITANRISYVFDLHGPSMTIDTACSSSLVALHQACQSIRIGETDAAVVGGISLHLHPYAFVGFSKASMLSRRGHCSVFDAEADGYVRSEGGGIVLLKSLEQAVADGNRILAVIAGTGVNSDGRKSGLTVPSHQAQAALLTEVYAQAAIEPGEIDYFEAHGTGTAVGDPLETRAIGEALGRHRRPDRPLPIGSIKGNVGHLEAAAGMAGLVKALHVLRERRVPPNIHLHLPNPHIDFSGWNLAPVRQVLPLASDRRLVVGVSAFGFGGTNAHAVLTSYEEHARRPRLRPAPLVAPPPPPLLLSARSADALRQSAHDLARHLRTHEEQSVYDIAYTLAFHRELHPQRMAAQGAYRQALVSMLEQFAATGAAAGVSTGRSRTEASGPVFIYSGNGSQWAGMGLQLLEEDPVFRQAVTEVDSLFRERTGESILLELRHPQAEQRLALTEIAQPALFAIQVGLTRALHSRGVQPVAVCGHSVGEVAAAWACGALSLDQAVRLIHERSAHQARTQGQGCMTAANLSAEQAKELLSGLQLGERLTIAAINSPSAVTLSGELEAMTRLESVLTQRRVPFQRLALNYAFHSAAMEPIRDDLISSLRDLPTSQALLPIFSSVTGQSIEAQALGAPYWWRNVREPVDFHGAIRSLIGAGLNTWVEIGPRPVLAAYLTEISKPLNGAALTLPSVTRQDQGRARLDELAMQLELCGAPTDRARLFPEPGQQVDLPHYPWQRERHWQPTTVDSLGQLNRGTVHPLLGYALGGDALHWENHLDVARLPLYADHVVGGSVVFPAAGFIEMALAASSARRVKEGLPEAGLHVIEDLEILSPLVLEPERSCTVRMRVEPADGRFAIISRDRSQDHTWRTHATGRLVEGCLAAAMPPLPAHLRRPDLDAPAHYRLAQNLGLEYGPAFRRLNSIWFLREGVFGTLSSPTLPADRSPPAMLHPADLDGAFQLLADLSLQEPPAGRERRASPSAFLPVRIDRLELLQPHVSAVAALATVAGSPRRSRRSLRADFTLYDSANVPFACARGVRFRAVTLQRSVPHAARWIGTRAVPAPRRDGRHALAMPAVAELARHGAGRLHAPARVAERQRFALEFEPLLDALCAAFAARALRELAGSKPFDPRTLFESGRVAPSGASLLHYLLQLLRGDGLLQNNGELWFWQSGIVFPEPEAIWTSLVADYPEHASLTGRVGAAGLHLKERLRAGNAGTTREGLSAWIEGCTQQQAAEITDALAAVLRVALAAQPPENRLRILRVMGAAPREGLAPLPPLDADRCDLVLCAATQELLDDVRSRWPAAALACHVLDLDRELTALGPLGGGFDIVVLGEGFADAPDPALRLANVRQLLLAAGRLVVLEQHSSRASDLVYGLAADWWQALDSAFGPVRPRRRAPEAWSETLSQAGFIEIETVRDVPGALTGPYLLLGQASASAPSTVPAVTPAAPGSARTWLLVHDRIGYSAELAAALAAGLEAAGQGVFHILSGAHYARCDAQTVQLDPADPAHWQRLIGELPAGSATPGWIHLAGLDLATAALSPTARSAALELRAAVLAAWLQVCTRLTLRADCWVIAAQAGAALLPAAAAIHGTAKPPADALRDAALWGVARVAMQECTEQTVRWIDLAEPTPCQGSAARVLRELLDPDSEGELILTASGRYATRVGVVSEPRWPSKAPPEPRQVQLDCPVPGQFRNLQWRPANKTAPLAADELEIEVRAAGLNFRDVMYAMGLLPDEAVEGGFSGATLGMEVAGVVRQIGASVADFAPGDEVIAFTSAGFSNRVRTRALATVRKPRHWSFAAAATVPTAFFTAYYALLELAQLRERERVLIHGAAGGVGIAAIQLAKHVGAEIFASAGTAEKRDFVRLLGADHVFDSRSLAFSDQVLSATGGQGVDVVLNSLAGEAMLRSLKLLRPFGRMLELGKRDFYEDSRLGLRPFRNNISYFGIDADQLLAQRPEAAQRTFIDLMSLFADGTLQPLPHRTFDAADIATAFRHMQASHHIGKIVVTFPDNFDPLGAVLAEAEPLTLRADATYVVSGGLSGFGLSTAWWLVEHGARHLLLLGRRGAAGTPEAAEQLAKFAAAGVQVLAPPCDVADANALAEALTASNAQQPPVRGVVHAAMVIEDSLLRDLQSAQLQRVLAPKVLGALNLHAATGNMPLDFFVLYSSATTQFGNPGQAAYVAANMALEALADERRALGLPVTCIGWGPIADVGYLARNERILEAMLGRIGGEALSSQQALQALEAALAAPSGNLGYLDLDWSSMRRSLPRANAPKFADLTRLIQGGEHGAQGQESAQELRRRLAILSGEELTAALAEIVRAEVAEILRVAPERIEPRASLLDLGMDSLMAVELATSLEVRLDVQFSAMSISGGPTVEAVVERLERLLQPGSETTAHDGEAETIQQVQELAARHVEQVSPIEALEFQAELRARAPRSLTRKKRL